jgi:hypothetical protein
LTADHLLQAVPEVRPLSQTDSERVAAMTEWLKRHTKPASESRTRVVGSPKLKRGRRVAV